MSKVDYEVRDGVAILGLNSPPVNALSHAVRVGIIQRIDQANFDPEVSAIVVTGSSAAFSAGADISEFGSTKARQAPDLRSVIQCLEESAKPVVAAISGNCLGGGLELAMGAHYRVALADAQLGLPEVKLGLLPGAGGTQRLPRALGLKKALNLILSGRIVKAQELAQDELLDEVVSSNVLEAALKLAQKVVAIDNPHKRLSARKVNYPGADAYLQFARDTVKALNPHFPAPLQNLEAVAASVSLPFEQGMANERKLLNELMGSAESKALRHIFFAEREATKIPDIPNDMPLRAIDKVAVIGAGTMGTGIAMNFLNVGIPVVLLETNQEALDKGVATIQKNYANTVKRGRLTQEQMNLRLDLLLPVLSYDKLHDVDLAIEAVYENIEVKQAVFQQLDRVMKLGSILASNTSTLDLNKIAEFTSRPQDVIGLHFFSPANIMKLLEIVRGEKTDKSVLATSVALAKKIGKKAVVSGVCDGFIGNRMVNTYLVSANQLVLAGAVPHQVDKALEKFGFAMGPYRMSDLAGLDIGWAIRKRRAAENPGQDFSSVSDKLCEAGRFGQKTGAGFYRYDPTTRKSSIDPVTEQLIQEYRQEKGVVTRKISEQEIVERCVFALVNEGAKILEEGIALRASDIDVVYLNGYGFPAHRGGPMHYAQHPGLFNVVRKIQQFAQESEKAAQFWQIAPLLAKHADSGETLL